MVTLTITNNHTGHTFRERVERSRLSARLGWYTDRADRYRTPDGRPGWTWAIVR